MKKETEQRRRVIIDANVLINFIKIDRLNILQQLQMYSFFLSSEVYDEISYPKQRLVLDQALNEGWLKKTEITDPNELRSYAQYRRQMGNGEAACLAIAICRQWTMACDERKKKLIFREVQRTLGEDYMLNTLGLLLKALREGILTVSGADAIKDALAEDRFIMKFASFQDLL